MAIKIRLGNNIVIEPESENDLRTVLSVLGYTNGLMPQSNITERLPDSMYERLRRFYRKLRSEQHKKILGTLASNLSPDGVSDAEINQALSLNKPNILGALMASLARNAKTSGLQKEHVLMRHVQRTSDGKRVYMYKLTPEMREVVQQKDGRRSRQPKRSRKSP